MGKIMKNGVAYSSGSNGGSNASDIAYDSSNIISAPTVEGTQDNAANMLSSFGTAATKNVVNSLSTWYPDQGVLDAYQGKLLGDRMTTAEGDIDTLNDGYSQLAPNVFMHHKTITGTITMAASSSGQAGFSVGIDWSVAFAVVRQQDASKLVFLSMGYVDRNNCYVNWRSERTSQADITIRIDIFGY